MNFLVEQFKETDGINLTKDTAAMQRLREEAEKAKKELSSAMNANINLPFIAMTNLVRIIWILILQEACLRA